MNQPEPFTHCYNCQEPIWDLKDLDNLGFLPVPETESSAMVCAKCTKKLGLRTVRELSQKPLKR
jgi:hypothetical protein